MSEDTKRTSSPDPGLIRRILSRGRLVWRLVGDRRVPAILKTLPVLTLLYVISPVDLLPALAMGPLAPLGTLDDLGVILLGLNFFITLVPSDLVSEHERELAAEGSWQVEDDDPAASSGAGQGAEGTPPVVDGSFRVVNEDDR